MRLGALASMRRRLSFDHDASPPRDRRPGLEASPYDARPAEADLWFVPPPPEDEAPARPRAGAARGGLAGGRGGAGAGAGAGGGGVRAARRAGAAGGAGGAQAAGAGRGGGDLVAGRRPGGGGAAGAATTSTARTWGATTPARSARRTGRCGGSPCIPAADRGPRHGLDAFLAREGVAADPAVPGWEDGLAALGAALPLVRAAWGFAAWRAAGLSAGVLEPAVIAARLGGAEGRGLGFLPLAQVAAPYFAGGDAARGSPPGRGRPRPGRCGR